MNRDELKRQAAEYAAQFVESGMVVGLGTGSTAIWAARKIGAWLQEGTLTDIIGIPTSVGTADEARQLGIPLSTLEEHPAIDVTIDGADEVDPDLNLIKGGGGALLREKIVAQVTARQIIVVDEAKLSERLGMQWGVPVEVVPFGWSGQKTFLESLGADVVVRQTQAGAVYHTDQGNLILDCNFGMIDDAVGLGLRLIQRAGIVEHGLFIGLTSDVIVARPNGIEHQKHPEM
jgi:ribose 5-phosphate isomerase A